MDLRVASQSFLELRATTVIAYLRQMRRNYSNCFRQGVAVWNKGAGQVLCLLEIRERDTGTFTTDAVRSA